MGIYTYELSAEGYKTVQARIGVLEDTTVTIEMEKDFKIVDFSSGTDEEIATILEAHYAGEIDISDYWAVGDTRTIQLTNLGSSGISTHVNQKMTMVIIGFNHDDLKEQIGTRNKTAITVQCREVLGNNGTAEENEYYYGFLYYPVKDTENYLSSNNKVRTWYNQNFINAMPETFNKLIKTVNKKNLKYHTKANEAPIIGEEKVFSVSYPEVFGTAISENYLHGASVGDYEGEQYEYYKTSSNVQKYINNNGNKGTHFGNWLLRSPSSINYIASNYGYGFMYVHETKALGLDAPSAVGLAPAFCL